MTLNDKARSGSEDRLWTSLQGRCPGSQQRGRNNERYTAPAAPNHTTMRILLPEQAALRTPASHASGPKSVHPDSLLPSHFPPFNIHLHLIPARPTQPVMSSNASPLPPTVSDPALAAFKAEIISFAGGPLKDPHDVAGQRPNMAHIHWSAHETPAASRARLTILPSYPLLCARMFITAFETVWEVSRSGR